MRINLKNSNKPNKGNLETQKLDDSRTSTFQINLHKDKVEGEAQSDDKKIVLAIIGITRREKIVMIVEYKNSNYKLHIPAKTVDRADNLEEMAREVFFRTTGYDGQMKQVNETPITTETGKSIYTFAASNCQKTRELVFATGSGIEVREVSVQEFLDSVAGQTTDNLGSAFMALDHLGMLDV